MTTSIGPLHGLGPIPPPTPHAPPANLIHPDASTTSSIQTFIQQNKKTLLVSAAAAAAVGAGYYYYSTNVAPKGGASSSSAGGSEKGGSSVGGGKKKKKSKSKGGSSSPTRKKTVNDPDGPLLEEIVQPEEKDVKVDVAAAAGGEEPRLEGEEGKEEKKEEKKVQEAQAAAKKDDIPSPSAQQIKEMSTEDRTSLATLLKSRGNATFAKKDFSAAIDYYSRAIAVSPEESSIFYSNRAASYNSLTPPQHDKVIADCDSALRLDPVYIKALRRRAAALEALDRDEEAVRDYTVLTLLEASDPPKAPKAGASKAEQSSDLLEAALKKMATREAQETLRSRPVQLPSSTFINAYLDAFRPHPAPVLPTSPTQADETLDLAFKALEAGDHTHAFTLAGEALSQGITSTEGKAEALNLRGTFKFLINDREGAQSDFEESIALMPSLVQSRIKLASVHMELGAINDTFGDFESAIAQSPSDPDIYYHRGQVYFIAGELDKAIADYTKSCELDEEFIFSHVQKAVTEYRLGKTQQAMASFRKILKRFPERSEPYNYYGELLLAEERHEDAIQKFDRAIEIENARTDRHKNVLPMVNKANCLLRWKEDFATASSLIEDALAIDSQCDVAVVTLAQLSLQQGKLEQAIEMFGRAKDIARTEEELVQATTFYYATKAQKAFSESYPEQHTKITQMMEQMAEFQKSVQQQ